MALLAVGRPGAAEEPGDRPSIRAIVTLESREQLLELWAADLDVTAVRGAVYEVLATASQLEHLRAWGVPVRVVDPDVYEPDGERASTFLPEYLSYSEVSAALQALASNHPTLTVLSSLGQSTEGRDIWALKISDQAATDESEPEVLILGNTHAREQITQIICVAMAESLLTNYGSDPQYTEWVNEREIWFVPVLNPDGLVWVETDDLFWRKNRWVDPADGVVRGVDLNRNYAHEWGHDEVGSSGAPPSALYRGPAAASEPEVQAMQDFVDSREFRFCISYHAFGNLTLWGPGFKPAIPEDQDIFREFGSMVEQQNGYSPGNTGMGNIYITNGVMDDWVYLSSTHSKVYGLTPEVGTDFDYFNPSAARIPFLVIEGSVAGWAAIEHADRPEKLAPPGPPVMSPPGTSPTGDYEVAWSPPTAGDTEVVAYELTEKESSAVVAEGFEGLGERWNLGGWSVSETRAWAGSKSLHSGTGDSVNHVMMAKEGYVVQPGDSLTFRAWYEIETTWDWAYALLSTDGGRSFTNLEGTATTMNDPWGRNADHGFTGSSGGWQHHAYDLAPWVGRTVWLGLRYYTDGIVHWEGVYVDELHPVQTWATETVLSSAIGSPSYAVTGKPNGTYWYTARALDAEGDWGYPSATVSMTVDAGTDVAALEPAPLTFSLSWSAPNPFTGNTSIRFYLPSAGQHSLVVYDVGGRRVASLSSGWAAAGPYEVQWNGRSHQGTLLPSGVYYYWLSARGREVGRPVVLRR